MVKLECSQKPRSKQSQDLTELLKADFHIHSKYSMDCTMPLEDIIKRCIITGINCIAIADHDSVDGAIEAQKLAPFPVIVAEEILTPEGEIMGMFLKERIPSGMAVEQAISQIKAQGALVCLQHPFDPLRGLKIDSKRLQKLMGQIDIVEVFNARARIPWSTTKAQNLAREYNLPEVAGSDAHTPGEIGKTYVEMPEFEGKDDFVQALRKGRISRHRSSFLVHFSSVWSRLKKSL